MLNNDALFFTLITEGEFQLEEGMKLELHSLNEKLINFNYKAIKTYDNKKLLLKKLKESSIPMKQCEYEILMRFFYYYFKEFTNRSSYNKENDNKNNDSITNKDFKYLLDKGVIVANDEKGSDTCNYNFTDRFIIQNEAYLEENFSEYFGRCEFCKYLKVGNKPHKLCIDKYNMFLRNEEN